MSKFPLRARSDMRKSRDCKSCGLKSQNCVMYADSAVNKRSGVREQQVGNRSQRRNIMSQSTFQLKIKRKQKGCIGFFLYDKFVTLYPKLRIFEKIKSQVFRIFYYHFYELIKLIKEDISSSVKDIKITLDLLLRRTSRTLSASPKRN